METLSQEEIAARIAAFDERLAAIKSQLAIEHGWYPYNSLGGFYELMNGPAGEAAKLFELAGTGPILDLCCADGDVAFFLQSLGYRVTAVDLARTNYNRLEGARAMRQALNSSVEIRELDLDSQFSLNANYGLVIFMGGLYHLKNPFYVMDTLARHACYVLLSTRIARFSPGGGIDLSQIPVAYLLDDQEANADGTNYWIFSEPGLRRLFQRTNWSISSFLIMGAEDTADPSSNDADARVFCLLRSRLIPQDIELRDGWHKLEDSGWRWTMRRFSITLPNPPVESAQLLLKLALAEPVLEALGPVTLTAISGSASLGSQTYSSAGECEYRATLSPATSVVQFELDKAISPGALGDDRELGLIVLSIEVLLTTR